MKNIIITGINRGLGKELFKLFIAKGYDVFGVLRNASAAEALQKDLPANGRIIITDLSTDASIEKIQAAVKGKPIDLLINNAGLEGTSFSLDEVKSEEILALFNVHCFGVLRTMKAVKENLLKARDPIVINLNSRFGSITRQSQGVYDDLEVSYSYRIAKASQNMLTMCLRKEFNDQIKFISLHPGKMKTDIAQSDADTTPEIIAGKILEYYESGKFREENGIVEIDRELIEW